MRNSIQRASMTLATWSLLANSATAQIHVDRTLSVTPRASTALDNLPATAATPVPPTSSPAATPAQKEGAARQRASGSYQASAMGASIVAKNADYATTFKITSIVPPGSTISHISWRYGLSEKPVGFEAVLCWDGQQPCWNVTNENSGDTIAFNGKDASRPFTLFYHVRGGGPLGAPAQGQLNQLTVSYDLP